MARQSSKPASTSRRATTTKPSVSSQGVASQKSNTQAIMPQQHNSLATNTNSQGFLSRVAETATGVAIGHVVGRALTGAASSLFGGSSSQELATNNNFSESSTSAMTPSMNTEPNCQPHLSQFLACMDRNNQDPTSCQLYLELLGQCRSGSTSKSTWSQDSTTF